MRRAEQIPNSQITGRRFPPGLIAWKKWRSELFSQPINPVSVAGRDHPLSCSKTPSVLFSAPEWFILLLHPAIFWKRNNNRLNDVRAMNSNRTRNAKSFSKDSAGRAS